MTRPFQATSGVKPHLTGASGNLRRCGGVTGSAPEPVRCGPESRQSSTSGGAGPLEAEAPQTRHEQPAPGGSVGPWRKETTQKNTQTVLLMSPDRRTICKTAGVPSTAESSCMAYEAVSTRLQVDKSVMESICDNEECPFPDHRAFSDETRPSRRLHNQVSALSLVHGKGTEAVHESSAE